MDEVILNKNGNNSKITCNILSDEEMRKYGFTDYNPNKWYLCKGLKNEITFNVSINKNDPSDWRIDIIDEDFLQPYDYQYLLEKRPNFAFANTIKEMVEEYMKTLKDAGIINGHEYGEYI